MQYTTSCIFFKSKRNPQLMADEKRRPNGIWIIRRGTKHSLEKMFQDISSYYLKWKDQSPAVVRAHSDWRKINLIEFFRKKIDAISFACEISEEGEPE